MQFRLLALSTTAVLVLSTAGLAQNIHFNEIYASHSGSDTSEYIELIGTPGMSLDHIVVCMVEGQGDGQGRLDRVWDLTGLSVPADGFFLMGDLALPSMDYNLANGPHGGGSGNNIENGAETFYLLDVTSAGDITHLENVLYDTDIDPDGDLNTVLGENHSTYTILDSISLTGYCYAATCTGPGGIGPNNVSHDCATTFGPEIDSIGVFHFPPGIARPGDYPNDWCADPFLSFTPGATDQTPGSSNPSNVCGWRGIGQPFCDPQVPNSTGFPTSLTGAMGTCQGSGLHLESNQGPPGKFGYLLIGNDISNTGQMVANSNGLLCLGGHPNRMLGRYNSGSLTNSMGNFDASGVFQNSVGTSLTGSGFDVPSEIPSIGGMIMPGETWHFQLWHREGGGSSNFSNGLSVLFTN